jgi:DNA-binding LacI/PurR family transcriptional regulator
MSLLEYKQHRTITLQDIANAANCSRNTACLAVRNSKRISKEKRELIQKIATELDYVPNMAARNLRFSKTGIVGIYAFSLNDAVRVSLANSLVSNLHINGKHPVLGLNPDHEKPWFEDPWMQSFQSLRAEAIVVISGGKEVLPSWAKKTPIILVGCMPDEQLKCDYVALDRKAAAFMAISHLESKGHKNIMIVSSDGSSVDKEDLSFARSSLNIANERNMLSTFVPIVCSSNFDRQLDALLVKLLEERKKYSALVFSDTQIAVTFMTRLFAMGIDVPGELAIISYDYFPWTNALRVPITTIEQPVDAITFESMEIIKKRIGDPNMPFIHKILPHKLVVRNST